MSASTATYTIFATSDTDVDTAARAAILEAKRLGRAIKWTHGHPFFIDVDPKSIPRALVHAWTMLAVAYDGVVWAELDIVGAETERRMVAAAVPHVGHNID